MEKTTTQEQEQNQTLTPKYSTLQNILLFAANYQSTTNQHSALSPEQINQLN
ncbi:MAG: hypothetical protein Q4D14_05845 [Bacteroidales bacterium]|nr:hypothetical protein [Bacteroidales bacterium]